MSYPLFEQNKTKLINQRKKHACAPYVMYISGTWVQVSIHYLAVSRAEISIKNVSSCRRNKLMFSPFSVILSVF